MNEETLQTARYTLSGIRPDMDKQIVEIAEAENLGKVNFTIIKLIQEALDARKARGGAKK